MAGRNYKIYVQSVFEPLVEACGREDLLSSLKTVDVGPERRKEQFRKFKSLQLDSSNVVYLPNGGFAAILNDGQTRLIAVSSSGLNGQDEEALNGWATESGLTVEELDESTFIYLAHVLKGYYRLRDQYRASEDALNTIDVISADYQGHNFPDLYALYRPVFIFGIPQDNILFSADIFRIGCEICSSNPSLRSQIIDETVNDAIIALMYHKAIDSSNLFQALTSAHWRYVFLEFFRVLESIFYLPWVLDLKVAGGIAMRASALKASCRASLHWRENQKPSMERLFGMLAGDSQLDAVEDKLECFKDLKHSQDFKRSQLGSRIYKIRNSLVHHEDFEDPTPYVLRDDQWRWISLYLALVVDRIYAAHERDLSPALAA